MAAGAFLAPRAPALYDGIGFPDEPYRYAQVVSDDPVKTPPPTTASATVTEVAGASAQGVVLTSTETGPQILAYLPKGAVLSGTAGTLDVSARPLGPDKPPPANGPIAGDIYRLSTSVPTTWQPGLAGTISLRSPQGIPVTPVMEFRRAGQPTWLPLPTTQVGNDIWESPLRALGDYALVLPTHATAAAAPKNHTLVYLLTAIAVCVAAALIGARLALRSRPGAVSDEPADG